MLNNTLIGLILMIIGIVMMAIGIMLLLTSHKESRTEGGAVILIGPIPIILASNKKIAIILAIIAIVILIYLLYYQYH
ncbi:MAG: DUF131 domain-containing protein [Desulfurococcales archaeon]|nr:DUF131 domain-containing protein [Desulfurococcales archaeon]